MAAVVASLKYNPGKSQERILRKNTGTLCRAVVFQQTLETFTSEYGLMSIVTVRQRIGIPVRFVGSIVQ